MCSDFCLPECKNINVKTIALHLYLFQIQPICCVDSVWSTWSSLLWSDQQCIEYCISLPESWLNYSASWWQRWEDTNVKDILGKICHVSSSNYTITAVVTHFGTISVKEFSKVLKDTVNRRSSSKYIRKEAIVSCILFRFHSTLWVCSVCLFDCAADKQWNCSSSSYFPLCSYLWKCSICHEE